MASVLDVAAFILRERGRMSAMKLEKLVYYSQAWSVVWDDPPDAPLFPERIEAWAYGPVCPALYDKHRGQVVVDNIPSGDPDTLTTNQRETVQVVLDYYADRPTWALSDLTHMEPPWRDARGECPAGAWCENEITLASMQEYYASLSADD
jgi:uncharacterized phage-associated protein